MKFTIIEILPCETLIINESYFENTNSTNMNWICLHD